MKLSTEQTNTLNAIKRWLTGARQTFLLAGYAGTGKTTLLQEFINGQSNIVTCCAPTGKAASVLQKKLTNARVSTIHKALYTLVAPSTAMLEALEAELLNNPESDNLRQAVADERECLSKKDLRFSLKADSLITKDQLVVIDEASMVTKRMRKDLEDTGAKILYVGDPGQLPPVMDEGFFERYKPDAMLEQVQRQAAESPIIQASMRIRAGATVMTTGDAPGAFRKVPKEALAPKEWLTYDQVITGTNLSRRRINRYFRRQLGHTSIWPMNTEKLICLKNDQDGAYYYINGIQSLATRDFAIHDDFQELQGDLLYEGQLVKSTAFYQYPFAVHYRDDIKEDPWQTRIGMREFDYAYAITVHKSQGSEWDRVLFADDGMSNHSAEFRKRWLYTAVTRAKNELIWLY